MKKIFIIPPNFALGIGNFYDSLRNKVITLNDKKALTNLNSVEESHINLELMNIYSMIESFGNVDSKEEMIDLLNSIPEMYIEVH